MQELWVCFNNMNIIKDVATSTPVLKNMTPIKLSVLKMQMIVLVK